MALPIIDHVIRTAFEWRDTSSGAQAVNVLHFLQLADSPADLHTALMANLVPGQFAAVSSEAKLQAIHYTVLTTALGASLDIPVARTDLVGGGALDYTPEHCAIIKLGTGVRGRSFRGRIFLPWVAEGNQFKGKLDNPTVATMTTDWTAFLAAMGTDGMPLMVASYKLSTASEVSTAICEPFCAVQRRRQSRLRS